MDKVTPEIKSLLKENKFHIQNNKKNLEECVSFCEKRAQNQIQSYLKLILGRLTETNKVNGQIMSQEECVSDLLAQMHNQRHDKPYYDDFDDLV